MIKAVSLALGLVVLTACTQSSQSASSAESPVASTVPQAATTNAASETSGIFYFFNDPHAKQWCAFKQQATFNSAAETAAPITSGTAEFKNGKVTQLTFTQGSESRDWAVTDTLTFNGDGQAKSIRRLIEALPGDVSVTRDYDPQGQLIKETVRNLGSGELLTTPAPSWLPVLPVHTQLEQFDVSTLLADPAFGAREKICIAKR